MVNRQSPPSNHVAERVTHLGVGIDNLTWNEALSGIGRLVEARRPAFVVTPNVDHIVRFQNDPDFAQIYASAAMVLADGMPLLWGSRFLGQPIKEKISGSDLVPRISELASRRGYRLYLLGGREGAAAGAARVLEKQYPGLQVAGYYCPPFGFEHDPVENRKITELIKEARPDILLVGLGSPKQEKWIARHYQEIAVPVCIGIGVTFEFIAGLVKRAPRWMQGCGLEWLWRLMMEPKRLWRRYLVQDMRYFHLLLKEKVA